MEEKLRRILNNSRHSKKNIDRKAAGIGTLVAAGGGNIFTDTLISNLNSNE